MATLAWLSGNAIHWDMESARKNEIVQSSQAYDLLIGEDGNSWVLSPFDVIYIIPCTVLWVLHLSGSCFTNILMNTIKLEDGGNAPSDFSAISFKKQAGISVWIENFKHFL